MKNKSNKELTRRDFLKSAAGICLQTGLSLGWLSSCKPVAPGNGTPTPDVASFVKAVEGLGDRESVRLQLVELDGREQMVTMRLDLEFWPSWELTYDNGVWTRSAL